MPQPSVGRADLFSMVETLLSTSSHEGVPINVISRQLGHANSAVTARYIDHIAPAQVVDAMQRRTWAEPGK